MITHMNQTSKWTSRDQAQCYIDHDQKATDRGNTLSKQWLRFPVHDDGVKNPVELTATEKVVIHDLFGRVTRNLCSPNSRIESMLEDYIVQKSSSLSTPPFCQH